MAAILAALVMAARAVRVVPRWVVSMAAADAMTAMLAMASVRWLVATLALEMMTALVAVPEVTRWDGDDDGGRMAVVTVPH